MTSLDPEGEFGGGHRFALDADDEPGSYVVVDERSNVVARLRLDGHRTGVVTRTSQWSIGFERVGRGWAVVARGESGEPEACCYPRWRPGVYDVWVAPDSWFSLKASWIRNTWALFDLAGDGVVARFDKPPRGGYPTWIETAERGLAVHPLPLLLLLCVESIRLEPGVPAGDGG